MNFFHLLVLLEKGNKTQFDCPVEEQKAYLASLGKPGDLYDRSYKQYRCQMYLVPVWKRILLSISSALIFPFLLVFLLLRGLKYGHKRDVPAVSDFTTLAEVIPEQLIAEWAPDSSVWDNATGLKINDIGFIFHLFFRFILYPYLVLKLTMKIALYRLLIVRYSPKAIVVHNEYSFTSSILTAYCRKNGILHIDVMHGEKLFYIRDSFFCYDKCYVWDQHYVDLFVSLQADPHQFIIAVPPSLRLDTSAYLNQSVYADIKYYLALNKEEEIASIVSSLKPARDAGLTVKYRLHPRYSDRQMILRYCSEEDLEKPEEVSIQESLSNLAYAAGSYSTVLLQASMAGKKVILDDVTYKKTYEQLKGMDYILARQPHLKLSKISEICVL